MWGLRLGAGAVALGAGLAVTALDEGPSRATTPSTTTTTTSTTPRPTTTVTNVVDLASGSGAPPAAEPADDTGTAPAIWVALAAGTVAMAAILRQELSRPT